MNRKKSVKFVIAHTSQARRRKDAPNCCLLCFCGAGVGTEEWTE